MYEYDQHRIGCYNGWRRYEKNPVIGFEAEGFEFTGECFDMDMVERGGEYLLYFSSRTHRAIYLSKSADGLTWSKPVMVLAPRPENGWEFDVNRPSVIYKDGLFHLWYAALLPSDIHVYGSGGASIGYAVSEDGLHFERRETPVMVSDEATWEERCVTCPYVRYDEELKLFRMWYSGGQSYEPECIGYAVSGDGVHWVKTSNNPILTPDESRFFEQERVTAATVIKQDGWHYMFYVGFENMCHTSICMARSKDGVTNWQRHPNNPIATGGAPMGTWDVEAVYKTAVAWQQDENRWLMVYNGGRAGKEQLGVMFHRGRDFGFDVQRNNTNLLEF